MSVQKREKKIFYICVTDKEGSLNRKYSECICELLNAYSDFSRSYTIEAHYMKSQSDIYESLSKAIRGNEYEGYIALLDCLETKNGTDGVTNPNVMLEFGAIRFSDRTFAAISYHSSEELPFDVRNLNICRVPECVVEYVKGCRAAGVRQEPVKRFITECNDPDSREEVSRFLSDVYDTYTASQLQSYLPEIRNKHKTILDEIADIKLMVANSAEYIDGERAAFDALWRAVRQATKSLRTTRFANESIVASSAIPEQTEFMKSLYEGSKKRGMKFDRIICNNHATKWNDIYNMLFYGGDGTKVYVRKQAYSIHFELVVIDEKVAFIHFYQTDDSISQHGDGESTGSGYNIEKLNSTLKIQGNLICKRLASIFDRLHHRDFASASPMEPSRTLLGIPTLDAEWNNKYREYGCFSVERDMPAYNDFSDNLRRRNFIIHKFKQAFNTWRLDDFEDKVNMLAGIGLVERKPDFINLSKDKITVEEYNEAMRRYEMFTDKQEEADIAQ